MQRYREKLKQDPQKYLAVKQKDAERNKLSRRLQKKKESTLTQREQEKLAERRKIAERIRKRDYRMRMAQIRVMDSENEHQCEVDEHALTPTKVYSSKQAAGKAMQRLRVKLPFSPRKRKAITLKLALESENKLETPKRIGRGVDKETEMKVVGFYNRDEISWAAPGMKDSQVVKGSHGEKDIQQKRYLTMNVVEAFQLFKAENPDAYVG
jgi:hypothetical protein